MKCWEFTNCGKGHESGCPAWPNNGERCADIVGTFCMDKDSIMGINAIKLKDCRMCEFYRSLNYKGSKAV